MNRTRSKLLIGTLILSLALAGGSTLAGSCSASKQADIVDTAVEAGSFNTLVAAVKAAGLVDALKGDGPLTVFAPTDEAFAKLPEGTLEDLLKPQNKDLLTAILTYHVAPGKLTADKVVELDRIKTLNGQRPAIVVDQDTVMIGGATVTATDILTSNGVIHVIDTVLLPEAPRASTTGSAEELIRMAIDRGVPLFNDGQPEACTAVYEIAAQSLMSSSELSDHDQMVLEQALAKVRTTHAARSQAWIMRHALNDVLDSLRSASDEMAMNR